MTKRGQKLQTTLVRDYEDICRFFDAYASRYVETQGEPTQLLQHRLALIRQYAHFQPTDAVMEIGCGHGTHLLGLADVFGDGLGVDLSPAMVQMAQQRAARSRWQAKLHFTVDQGEQLHSVADVSMDVVFCVGALEHMLDKPRVFAGVFRGLKPGGCLICLTPNGHYLWYRWLAPLLGLQTRHLSTDGFASPPELNRLVHESGFRNLLLGYWTFIPCGDMSPVHGRLLHVLDRIGRLVAPASLRGGLVMRADKHAPRQRDLSTPPRISATTVFSRFEERSYESHGHLSSPG
jgi:ubiquinone/menaquinone biosynthesis C-methylase UbiE